MNTPNEPFTPDNSQPKEFPTYNDSLPGSEPHADAVAPPVVKWYRIYCFFMVLLYAAAMAGGASIVLFHSQLAAQITKGGTELNDVDLTARGIILMMMSILMFSVNLAAMFLPRRPWAWVYHLVNIALGLTGCCFFVTIPLLIFWLKPETQQYFGRDTTSPSADSDYPPPPIPHV